MRQKKTASILKKFLLFNFATFSILGLLTIFYLKAIQPNLVKKSYLYLGIPPLTTIKRPISMTNLIPINIDKNEVVFIELVI